MCQLDADVVKIAVAAQEPADNLRVLRLMRKPSKPTVAFCMGDLGIPSRILGAKFRAPFTYAAFNKERGIAPGILSYDEIKRVYQYPRINPETKIFGLIGDPVAHSLSPLIHNTAFRSLGINSVYIPFRVPRAALEGFLKDFDQLPVHGYSVTIPHKEAAAEFAQQKDAAVTLTHAANTLVKGEDGFTAYNTDYEAARESLLANLPPGPNGELGSLHARTALILGAGGMARAMAHALQREGVLLSITNRTPERTHRLAEEVGCRVVEWPARHSYLCEILVNCTSVGMHPNLDDSPIHPGALKPGQIVMDSVYTPETTLLVKEARSRGCHVITGVDMFVRQAALQFQFFTGREPPLDLMRSVVRRAFSPVVLRDEE